MQCDCCIKTGSAVESDSVVSVHYNVEERDIESCSVALLLRFMPSSYIKEFVP